MLPAASHAAGAGSSRGDPGGPRFRVGWRLTHARRSDRGQAPVEGCYTAAPVTATLPQSFGRYTLIERIGEGGMAEVYLAEAGVAEGLKKRVVIKKIRAEIADEPEFVRMFVAEAEIALGLNHANVVQVFDFGRVEGAFYLAMELVEGLD